MVEIQLQATPSQNIGMVIGGQNAQLFIYTKDQGVFVDTYSDGRSISNAVIALDAVPLVRQNYLGFVGNFMFCDTQGNSNPEYTGFGTRYRLVYLDALEYEQIA